MVEEKKQISVTLVPFGQVEDDITYAIMKALKEFFSSIEDELECVPSFNVIRRPDPVFEKLYNRDSILLWELEKVPGKIVLGITDAGIWAYDPPRCIFGTGHSGNGILSTVRFKEKADGREKLKARLGKEALKVLGMACGMGHCSSDNCLLTYHRHVQDLDRNGCMCNKCLKELTEYIRQYVEDADRSA